jgi:uncharacterized membrane protein YkoI
MFGKPKFLAGNLTFALRVLRSYQPGKHPGEKVDLKSLPASVQETINQKAAGGSIVKILREDDPDGKWNYEVFVKANGKELAFEVDPNGKLVRHHE